jgi:MFS family permease
VPNYRLYAAGALVSNVGTWMQRTAQDWLVLTELTQRSATAVGIVTALQFGPQVLLLPWTGYAADRIERKKLLFATQATMGGLAMALGVLTLTGWVRLWHVYALAGALGCATAFDAPVRQSFVSELVGEEDLPNAIGLGSASFNAARMLGPAAAGLLIGAIGTGPVFVVNALSYGAVLAALRALREDALFRGQASQPSRSSRAPADGGRSLTEGFRYVWHTPDLRIVLLMMLLVGMFALNFPIFISTMAVRVFHRGPGQFGLCTSIMAVGSVTGSLLAAARAKPQFGILVSGAAALGTGLALSASMPSYALFCATLIVVGVSAQTFNNTVMSTMQLAVDSTVRGRVVAITMAVALGGMPVGAPVIGRVADTAGPRWSLAVAAAACFLATAIGLIYGARSRSVSTN